MINVNYNDINTKSFHDFIYTLEQNTRQSIISCQDRQDNIEDTLIGKALNTGFAATLSYFSVLEEIHVVSNNLGRRMFRARDEALINELSNNLPNIMPVSRLKQIKNDMILLLTIQSMNYYILAWSDAMHDSPFHIETYKHIWKGIKAMFNQRSFSALFSESMKSKYIEVFQRRTNAIRDINLLLLLYFYSAYKCLDNDIEIVSGALMWILQSRYSWFYVPAKIDHEILLDFLFWTIPVNDLGYPKESKIYEIYDELSNYRNSILQQYPNASISFRKYIEGLQNLPKKYQDWNDEQMN